jgi:hypothetical protein
MPVSTRYFAVFPSSAGQQPRAFLEKVVTRQAGGGN